MRQIAVLCAAMTIAGGAVSVVGHHTYVGMEKLPQTQSQGGKRGSIADPTFGALKDSKKA